jgi:basic amino acid/polyamine antiporter, APA family
VDPLACLSVLIFTILLCVGTRKSSIVNTVLVILKLLVVIFVIIVGGIYSEKKNWDNFVPFGVQGIFNGAAVVFFAFLGYGNSREERKRVYLPYAKIR